ncbi:MAG TPA: alpha/beta fold hydrolase [Gemmatimonadaceae bacterium]
MSYDDVGSGMPVVLIHGFPHNRGLWAPQLAALSQVCRCIAPDLRGFGDSDGGAPYSMDRYADDVAALLDALGVERAVVGGLSMGGYITLAFWRRHRERVLGLILADTRAAADDAAGRERRRAMIALARREGPEAVAGAMIESTLGKTTRQRHPEVVGAVHAMFAAASVSAIVGALEAMLDRPDSTPTLATIDVPTLIVVGDEDAISPRREAEAMRATIAGSRLEVIPGAGHASNVERPAAFNAVVTDFVRSLVPLAS